MYVPATSVGGDLYYSLGLSTLDNIPKHPNWLIMMHGSIWADCKALMDVRRIPQRSFFPPLHSCLPLSVLSHTAPHVGCQGDHRYWIVRTGRTPDCYPPLATIYPRVPTLYSQLHLHGHPRPFSSHVRLDPQTTSHLNEGSGAVTTLRSEARDRQRIRNNGQGFRWRSNWSHAKIRRSSNSEQQFTQSASSLIWGDPHK